MADGRHFTDYRPRCAVNQLPPSGNLSSFEYRQYLIANADALIRKNAETATFHNKCAPCDVDPGTWLPEKTVQKCNARTCAFNDADPAGLGIGRSYDTPESAMANLHAVQMESFHQEDSAANCCAAANDDLEYYPLHGNIHAAGFDRLTIPSGGKPFA
jgi:hypothetical protein